MSLSIKNKETHKLARELAQLTGETMTGAVTVALQERLERQREIQERLKRMRAISKRVSKMLRPGPSAVEHGDFLYDERGLPSGASAKAITPPG